MERLREHRAAQKDARLPLSLLFLSTLSSFRIRARSLITAPRKVVETLSTSLPNRPEIHGNAKRHPGEKKMLSLFRRSLVTRCVCRYKLFVKFSNCESVTSSSTTPVLKRMAIFSLIRDFYLISSLDFKKITPRYFRIHIYFFKGCTKEVCWRRLQEDEQRFHIRDNFTWLYWNFIVFHFCAIYHFYKKYSSLLLYLCVCVWLCNWFYFIKHKLTDLDSQYITITIYYVANQKAKTLYYIIYLTICNNKKYTSNFMINMLIRKMQKNYGQIIMLLGCILNMRIICSTLIFSFHQQTYIS